MYIYVCTTYLYTLKLRAEPNNFVETLQRKHLCLVMKCSIYVSYYQKSVTTYLCIFHITQLSLFGLGGLNNHTYVTGPVKTSISAQNTQVR